MQSLRYNLQLLQLQGKVRVSEEKEELKLLVKIHTGGKVRPQSTFEFIYVDRVASRTHFAAGGSPLVSCTVRRASVAMHVLPHTYPHAPRHTLSALSYTPR